VDRVRRRAALLLFATAALVYTLDRLTKLWAEHVLPGKPIDVIRGILTLRYTTNSGGAFSLGQSAPWLFAAATLVVVGLIVVTATRHTRIVTSVALGLVLGGALGNVTDRLARGHGIVGGRVVDFIDLHVWPVFNLADASIVVGALLLAVSSWWSDRVSTEPEAGHGGGSSDDG
jgi:signal peptidase II